MRIECQLLGHENGQPAWGPTKTGNVRTIDLSAQTVGLLQKHKASQAELKMRNRLHYNDHGLVFAQTWENSCTHNTKLGDPLSAKSLEGMLSRLIEAAKVRRITIHGLRHTSATLMLAAGVQPHVVQRRLGHTSIVTTLDIYASVLPSQQHAAAKLATLLHG